MAGCHAMKKPEIETPATIHSGWPRDPAKLPSAPIRFKPRRGLARRVFDWIRHRLTGLLRW